MPVHAPVHRPAVFLDRDDTLIRCTGLVPSGDLGDPGLVELLPGALEACGRLKGAGYALVVVTNQGGVARGRYTEADVHAVHERVGALLGGLIDTFRFCPYHPEGTVPSYAREHPWRKPAPGMILDAAEALGVDLGRSWMVGDAMRDVEAGHAAGCRTVLLSPLTSPPAAPRSPPPDHTVPTLSEAADLILGVR